MTPLTDAAAIFAYHGEMIRLHGAESSFALGWLDEASQLDRFRVLAGIADLRGKSVLDAGCGYGDLLPYLNALFGQVVYTGVEQIPGFLEEAMRRYGGLQHATFIAGDFVTMQLPASDYVLASGSLNYRSPDQDFIFKAIAKLYATCRLGLAFNLLSDVVPDGLLVAYDPGQIIGYCAPLCREVKLVSGYTADDFTVYMYR